MERDVILFMMCALSMIFNGILLIAINNLYRYYRWLASDLDDTSDEILEMTKDITGIKRHIPKLVEKDDVHKEVYRQINKRIIDGVIK